MFYKAYTNIEDRTTPILNCGLSHKHQNRPISHKNAECQSVQHKDPKSNYPSLVKESNLVYWIILEYPINSSQLASQRGKYPYQWDHLLPAKGKKVRKVSTTKPENGSQKISCRGEQKL